MTFAPQKLVPFILKQQLKRQADDEEAEGLRSINLDDFMLSDHEVTQAEWQMVMGAEATGLAYSEDFNNQFEEAKANYPVHFVSYHMAQRFMTLLNVTLPGDFRLPTEAEWEYAAIGGADGLLWTYAGSNILDAVAWYYGNAEYTAHPVKSKNPNDLDLYDMSGNVAEWCSDWYQPYGDQMDHLSNPKGPDLGEYRILRGGSFHLKKWATAVYTRNYAMPQHAVEGVGFRIAQSLEKKDE